jgi:hypothetical protein
VVGDRDGLRLVLHDEHRVALVPQLQQQVVLDAPDPRGAGGLVEPAAATLRTGGEGDRPVHERPDVRLHRLLVLGEERLLDLRISPS